MSISEDDEQEKKIYKVYRRRWYGESLFIICEEVLAMEEIVICKNDNYIVGILPKKDFSCAISTTL